MSRLGMKNIVARSIVDKDFRKKAFGNGADLKATVTASGYDVSDDELSMLSCNSEQSFNEEFVTIETMMDFWKISEERINGLVAGRKGEAGPLPKPGSVAEGF